MSFVVGIALALVLYVGGTEVANREITTGEFVQFNAYLAMLAWPMISLGWVINMFQQGAASMGRVMEVMNRRPTIRDTGRTLGSAQVHGAIEFRHVGVKYDNVVVLDDVSFTVERGSTVAIIGMTGVGKTTLMSLVPRVLEADAGEVLIDGVDVRRIPHRDSAGSGWIRSAGYIFVFGDVARERDVWRARRFGSTTCWMHSRPRA